MGKRDGLEREIEATIYDFNLNNMPAKRTAKRIMALIAKKDGGSKVPCSDRVMKSCPFCGTINLRFTPNGDHDGYVTHLINDCTMSGRDVPFRLWERRAL